MTMMSIMMMMTMTTIKEDVFCIKVRCECGSCWTRMVGWAFDGIFSMRERSDLLYVQLGIS